MPATATGRPKRRSGSWNLTIRDGKGTASSIFLTGLSTQDSAGSNAICGSALSHLWSRWSRFSRYRVSDLGGQKNPGSHMLSVGWGPRKKANIRIDWPTISGSRLEPVAYKCLGASERKHSAVAGMFPKPSSRAATTLAQAPSSQRHARPPTARRRKALNPKLYEP